MKASEPLTSGSDSAVIFWDDVHALAEFTHDLDYENPDSRIKQQCQLVLRYTLGTVLAGVELPVIRRRTRASQVSAE